MSRNLIKNRLKDKLALQKLKNQGTELGVIAVRISKADLYTYISSIYNESQLTVSDIAGFMLWMTVHDDSLGVINYPNDDVADIVKTAFSNTRRVVLNHSPMDFKDRESVDPTLEYKEEEVRIDMSLKYTHPTSYQEELLKNLLRFKPYGVDFVMSCTGGRIRLCVCLDKAEISVIDLGYLWLAMATHKDVLGIFYYSGVKVVPIIGEMILKCDRISCQRVIRPKDNVDDYVEIVTREIGNEKLIGTVGE